MTRSTDFDLYTEAHPNVTHPNPTRHAWDLAIARGEDPTAMVTAAENYANDLSKRHTRTRIMDAIEFIAPAGRWRDYTP